ncbi:hypothetical protein HC031_22840 [Planosporangium thailandense]|uniref:AP2/ERF domain-containing protein n=1 Tax=Planosporangium thailandense TaxID=765197 RepID=A0ABX0Y543_9ACTN|nr:hypothetical protein [Planosporangium thailandense]NJC72533.1 hypothetical protein [Planosporangium thailandense]
MPVAHRSLLIIQHAALVQLALVAFAVLVVALLLAPEGRRRLCETAARTAANRLRRTRHAARQADLHRYADEVAVAAERAATTAARRQEEWAEAQRNREKAWQAYEAADAAARRATEAAAYVTLESPGTVGDAVVNRRRFLDAATEAYRRGELSARQLSDIVAHRNGWDLDLHPCELEARLLRTIRRRLLADYQQASQVERAARHMADTAAAGKRSLDDEAFAAAERARLAAAVRIPRPRTSPELEASQPIQVVTAPGSRAR